MSYRFGNQKIPTSAANGAAEMGHPFLDNSVFLNRTYRLWLPSKLSRPEELPEGFLYRGEFLSEAEESELLRIFGRLEFAAYDYHGYQAKRRIVRYGVNYDINTREGNESAPPIPEFLIDIRERAAEFAGVGADDLVHAGCAAVWNDYWHLAGECLPDAAEAVSRGGPTALLAAGATIDLCDARTGAIGVAAQYSGGETVAVFDYVSYVAS